MGQILTWNDARKLGTHTWEVDCKAAEFTCLARNDIVNRASTINMRFYANSETDLDTDSCVLVLVKSWGRI